MNKIEKNLKKRLENGLKNMLMKIIIYQRKPLKIKILQKLALNLFMKEMSLKKKDI